MALTGVTQTAALLTSQNCGAYNSLDETRGVSPRRLVPSLPRPLLMRRSVHLTALAVFFGVVAVGTASAAPCWGNLVGIAKSGQLLHVAPPEASGLLGFPWTKDAGMAFSTSDWMTSPVRLRVHKKCGAVMDSFHVHVENDTAVGSCDDATLYVGTDTLASSPVHTFEVYDATSARLAQVKLDLKLEPEVFSHVTHALYVAVARPAKAKKEFVVERLYHVNAPGLGGKQQQQALITVRASSNYGMVQADAFIADASLTNVKHVLRAETWAREAP